VSSLASFLLTSFQTALASAWHEGSSPGRLPVLGSRGLEDLEGLECSEDFEPLRGGVEDPEGIVVGKGRTIWEIFKDEAKPGSWTRGHPGGFKY